MSVFIQQLVLRKRAIQCQIQADILARDKIIAAARGADGKDGKDGKDGRGIANVSIERGDLIVTYTDKKKQNVGKVISERVMVVGGGASTPTNQTPAPVEGEQAMYAEEFDFVNDSLFYKGEAVPGALYDNPVWRISRTVVDADGDVHKKWAEGNANFDKVWDDRLSYAYI